MRDIKFRAYDKAKHEYLSAGQIYLSIEPGSCPTLSKQYLDVISNPNAYAERFDIEQYTNCKDKNGIEIYEGDIVRWSVYFTTNESNVLYEGSGFWPLNVITAIKCDSEIPILDCEIIGNIHKIEKYGK